MGTAHQGHTEQFEVWGQKSADGSLFLCLVVDAVRPWLGQSEGRNMGCLIFHWGMCSFIAWWLGFQG